MNIQYLRRHASYRVMGFFFGTDRCTDAPADLLPTRGIFRILISRITHSLGNTLLLTPLIREIEAIYPGAEIDVLTRSVAADSIFGAFSSIRTIYRLPAHAFRHPLRFLGILRRMRRTQYDLVIDPCPLSQTGRLMLLLAKGRFKLGFGGDRKKGVLTHRVAVPATPTHAGQLPVFLLRSALGRAATHAYPALDFALTSTDRLRGKAMVARLTSDPADARGKKGVIGIFANATGPKLFTSAWWRSFMSVLETRYSDYYIIEIVPAFGKSLLDDRYPAFYSSDIHKLACVLSGLSLFVSADCGIMHLACASGATVIGLFTITDADEWGPYGQHDRAVLAKGLLPEQVAELVAGKPIR